MAERFSAPVSVILHGERFTLPDPSLVGVFTLINHTAIHADTVSFQNRFGFSSVTFTIDGFQDFLAMLMDAAEIRCNGDWNQITRVPLLRRFEFSTRSPTTRCHLTSGLHDGDSGGFSLFVVFEFLPSEVSVLEMELADLLGVDPVALT